MARATRAVALVAISCSFALFAEVQVLQSYPFHNGVYGSAFILPGLTYTVSLELSGAVSLAAVFVKEYSEAEGTRAGRGLRALGSAMLVAGLFIAPIVYIETRLLWGEVLPGVHLWAGIPGGGGYPWGAEQVAYNTCFIQSQTPGDCAFLNYDELFWASLLVGLVGYMLKNRGDRNAPATKA